MPSLNRVLLMGNLTRDPDLRYTPNGTAVADMAIAINRKIKSDGGDRDEVTFVDITLWGTLAETASQYLSKGRPVFVEGRLQLDQWDDKQSGQKRQRLKVVGEMIQFLGANPNAAQGPAPAHAPPPQQRHPHPASTSSALHRPGRPYDPALDPEPDDIPF